MLDNKKKKGARSRVAVFGVFDDLHPGHLYFLYHARLLGDELVAIIARDSSVLRLKGKKPNQNEKKRSRAVKDSGLATKVVLGDVSEGKYAVLKKIKADIIALGYDQAGLKKNLKKTALQGKIPRVRLVSLKSYFPKRYHSSILLRKRS